MNNIEFYDAWPKLFTFHFLIHLKFKSNDTFNIKKN